MQFITKPKLVSNTVVVYERADQPLIDKYGRNGYDMRLRLQVFGPFGNRHFVDRMTFDKKTKEKQKGKR